MRLLNTKTFELQDFFEDATPAYAILSHTWETEEVTYKTCKDQLVAKNLVTARFVGVANRL
jgi:hypothetical protein